VPVSLLQFATALHYGTYNGRLVGVLADRNRHIPEDDVIADRLPVVLNVVGNDYVRVSETRVSLSYR